MLTKIRYRGPSWRDLHQDYAKAGRIDSQAPLRTRQEIVISAPISRVWEKLTDIPQWADNLEPGVRGIRLDDTGVGVDATFVRRTGGMRLTARFAVVRPARELSWTGSSLGIKVVHRFLLGPLTPGTTRVTVEESMAGRMLLLYSQASLDRVAARSLATLKAAAEQP